MILQYLENLIPCLSAGSFWTRTCFYSLQQIKKDKV